MSALPVKARKYGSMIQRESALRSAPTRSARINPCVTAASARSGSLRPRYPAITTFTPTPIQMDAAFMSVVMGKDRDTAASAFSPSCATKALSTRL